MTADELADVLFASVVAGDVDTIRASVYAPHAVIWNTASRADQSVEENLRVLAWMHRTLVDVRYEDVRRHRTDAGFVQQHVLRARTARGTAIEVPACMVVTVEDGRIVRLEEYLDSAALAPLLGDGG